MRQEERQQVNKPHPKHNPEPASAPRTNLPRVMLVGMWPQVKAEVDQEFKEVLEVRYFDSNANDLAPMQRCAAHSALVLAETSVHTDIKRHLKAAAPLFESIHGSRKSLLDRLTRFAVQGK